MKKSYLAAILVAMTIIFLGRSSISFAADHQLIFSELVVVSKALIHTVLKDNSVRTGESEIQLVPAITPTPTPTLIVTKTADSNDGACNSDCSLREAIAAANANVDADIIGFNIPGPGVQTISILSALPFLTRPVTIDGYTQQPSVSHPNTQDDINDAVLLIELSGSSAVVGTNGLVLEDPNIVIRGLVINGFPNHGIIMLTTGTNNCTIEGNFIGTDPTGMIAVPNNDGVNVNIGTGHLIGGPTPAARNLISGNSGPGIFFNSGSNTVSGNFIGIAADGHTPLGNNQGVTFSGAATNITIGGTDPASRNVISANADEGIAVRGSGHIIQGNFIGTDASGSFAVGNANVDGTTAGIVINGGVTTNNILVGGSVDGAGNVISGNGNNNALNFASGMFLTNTGTNIFIHGNYIGTAANGNEPIPNRRSGISFSTGPGTSVVTIGGEVSGEGNVIAFNGESGVSLGTSLATMATTIRGNSIHSNSSLGIDIFTNGALVNPNDNCDVDSGPNLRQNYPLISSARYGAGSTIVMGNLNSVADTTYKIDLYSCPACDSPLAFGEGQTYLGSTTVTTGPGTCDGSFELTINSELAGQVVTATATDPLGNTSEFSACALAVMDPSATPTPTPDPSPTPTPNPSATPTQSPTPSPTGTPTPQPTATPTPDPTPTPNVPPNIADDSAVVEEDSGLNTIDVLVNDDTGGDGPSAVSITNVTQGAHGIVVNNGTALRYTPDPNYYGEDTFTYTATDGIDNGTATVIVTVTSVNDTPIALDDNGGSIAEDTPLSIPAATFVPNDLDVENDTLFVSSVGNPVSGTVSLSAGNVIFIPTGNYYGPASFEYTVSDGNGGTDIGLVSMVVTEVNDVPTAASDNKNTPEETPLQFPILDLLSNDSVGPANESNQTLELLSFTQPAHGLVIRLGNELRYVPSAFSGYNGPDGFTYTIIDNGTTNGVGDPKTAAGTVDILVTPVNSAPTAGTGSFTTNVNTPVAIDLSALASDSETADADLTYVIETNPSNGVLTGSGAARTYHPSLSFLGTDTFTFRVTDRGDPDNCGVPALACAAGASSPTRTVTINVAENRPDLFLGYLNTLGIGGPGAVLNVEAWVFNTGTGASPASTITFYYSTDNVLNLSGRRSDVIWGEFQVPSIGPGGLYANSFPISVPRNATSGNYFLIAVVDRSGAVTESNEGNNRGETALNIAFSDLTVSNLVLTPPEPQRGVAALPGDPVTVDLSIANIGAGPAAPTTAKLWLCYRDRCDNNLANVTVPQLARDGTYSIQISVTIPINAGLDDMREDPRNSISVTVDPERVINELNERNNDLSHPIRITLPDLAFVPLPDPNHPNVPPPAPFRVGDTLPPGAPPGTISAAVTAGESVDIYFTVTNLSSAVRSIQTRARFYLRAGRAGSGGFGQAVPLDGAPVDVVAPSESFESTTPHRIPDNLSPGYYTVFAEIDPDNNVWEFDELNNNYCENNPSLCPVISVLGPFVYPDLTVTVLPGPTVVDKRLGLSFDIQNVTQNVGGAVTGIETTTRFYLIPYPNGGEGEKTRVGDQSVPANLVPGQSAFRTTTLTIPSSFRLGLYYLIARADDDDELIEIFEHNNQYPGLGMQPYIIEVRRSGR